VIRVFVVIFGYCLYLVAFGALAGVASQSDQPWLSVVVLLVAVGLGAVVFWFWGVRLVRWVQEGIER
jgi:uncharacterized protein HemX